MTPNKIIVGDKELGRFVRDVLVAHGANAADAAIVAEGLVWANCVASTVTAYRACRAI